MESVLTQVILTAVVGAIAPLPVIIVITLLMSSRGALKAWAFTIGLLMTFTVVGIIALVTASSGGGGDDHGSVIGGTVITLLGGLLVVIAIKQLVNAPDPDAAPPKFMAKLDTMKPLAALLFGLIIAVINFKQLSIYLAGVAQIVSGGISSSEKWVALILLLVVLQIIPLAALITYVVARDWTTKVLEKFRGWLVEHNRVIGIVLGFVVGAAFIAKGLVQVIG